MNKKRLKVALQFIPVLCIAILLRLPGYDLKPLWIDELWRVNLILQDGSMRLYWENPNLYTAITAPLYLIVNKFLSIVSISPGWLRMSSFIPGLLSIFLVFSLLLKSGADLIWAYAGSLIFATNPYFIQYGNEFKPYILEVMCHLLCLCSWYSLMIAQSKQKNKLVVLFIVLTISLLSTATTIFILPAAAASIFYKLWKEKINIMQVYCGGFLAIGCITCLLYLYVWSYGSNESLIKYWSEGFFHSDQESYAKFLMRSFNGLWHGSFSTIGSQKFSNMQILSILGALAILYEWRKRSFILPVSVIELLTYSALFTGTLLMLNLYKLWPLGEFRPNLFIFAIASTIWALVLALILSTSFQRILGALCFFIATFNIIHMNMNDLKSLSPPMERSDLVWQSFYGDKPAGQLILRECNQNSIAIFTNPAMSEAAKYFTKRDTQGQHLLKDKCVTVTQISDAYIDRDKFLKTISENPSEIKLFTYSHLNNQEIEIMKNIALDKGFSLYDETFENAGIFAIKSYKLK